MRTGDLIVRQIGPETVVYDRRTHRAHCLGPLAAAVWRSWNGGRSAAEIARHLTATRGQPTDEIAVGVALRRLERARLVAPGCRPSLGGSAARRATIDPARREALRAVAALTGLAVLSVATPSPAQTASCIPLGGSCRFSSECCNLCCDDIRNTCAKKEGNPHCLPGGPARPR